MEEVEHVVALREAAGRSVSLDPWNPRCRQIRPGLGCNRVNQVTLQGHQYQQKAGIRILLLPLLAQRGFGTAILALDYQRAVSTG